MYVIRRKPICESTTPGGTTLEGVSCPSQPNQNTKRWLYILFYFFIFLFFFSSGKTRKNKKKRREKEERKATQQHASSIVVVRVAARTLQQLQALAHRVVGDQVLQNAAALAVNSVDIRAMLDQTLQRCWAVHAGGVVDQPE